MNEEVFEQIALAYRTMSDKAKFRPAAPSDGMGNLTVPEDQLDLSAEISAYASKWWADEDSQQFDLGCANFPYRTAMVLAVEGARMCCTSDGARAKQLLQLAADAIPE